MSKKKNIFFILLLIISFCYQVNNAYALTAMDGFSVFESENANDKQPFYIASGKNLDFFIDATDFSHIEFEYEGNHILAQDRKPVSIKVDISTSSNASCSLTALASSVYPLSGNTYTLADTSITMFADDIGKITCTMPTTSTHLAHSNNNYINITVTTTFKDFAEENPQETSEVKNYYMTFGVINSSYLRSLNDSSAVSSYTIDGQNAANLDVYETNNDKATFKVNTNGNFGKNKLKIMYMAEADYNEKELPFGNGEVTFPLQYGINYVYIEENTEKKIFLDSLNQDADQYGFQDGEFNYLSSDEGVVIKRNDTRSKVNTLKSLTISNVKIDFKPDLKFYNATVNNSVEEVTINSTLTDSKSSYVQGFGNRSVKLVEGKNTILIKVKAEHGEENVYTITITREESNDATLKELIVNGKDIKIEKDVYKYSMNVNNDITKVEVTATANHPKAVVSIENVDELQEGENEIKITVEAANKEKQIYVISVKRDGLISSNSNLKELKVEGYDLDFSQNIKTYNLKINDEQELNITAKADHEKAKVLITGNKNLKNGSVIKIKVTAEDETTTTYEINIEKEAKKKGNSILFIIGGALLLAIIVGVIILTSIKKKNKNVVPVSEEKAPEENIVNNEAPTTEEVKKVDE